MWRHGVLGAAVFAAIKMFRLLNLVISATYVMAGSLNMTLNKKRTATALALATAIAIPAEGLRQYAYSDPIGLLTVCWGSTTGVERGKHYSLEECKARLNEDMLDAIETVERCVPSLPEPVLAAFADAVFNAGPTIACDTKRSTAARLLASGRIEEACKQLPRWSKARVGGVMVELPGLTKRRQKEMELCLSGISS